MPAAARRAGQISCNRVESPQKSPSRGSFRASCMRSVPGECGKPPLGRRTPASAVTATSVPQQLDPAGGGHRQRRTGGHLPPSPRAAIAHLCAYNTQIAQNASLSAHLCDSDTGTPVHAPPRRRPTRGTRAKAPPRRRPAYPWRQWCMGYESCRTTSSAISACDCDERAAPSPRPGCPTSTNVPPTSCVAERIVSRCKVSQ